MTACVEPQTIEELCTKGDDVDLESLIQQIDHGNDESSPTDPSSSSGEGDLPVVTEKNDAIVCMKDDYRESPIPRPSFFEKGFLKSLPVAILSKRKFFGSNSELSFSTPNSPVRHSLPSTPKTCRKADIAINRKVDRVGSCRIQHGAKQMTFNVWVSDLGVSKDIEIPHASTCAILLHKLLGNLQRKVDLVQWAILEQNSETKIERFVEDYEVLDEVLTNQEPEQISRFCLNRTSAKYNILQHPEVCLPKDMLTFPPNSYPTRDSPDSVKRLQMQHILTKTAPELCGWLHVRDTSRRTWKKVYCILRNSGLYISNKGMCKDPQHLVCIAEVHSARVWFSISSKKHSGNHPTSHCFCLKLLTNHQEDTIRWFCAETNHSRSAWISGLRLTMNGSKFYESYLSARKLVPSGLVRSNSDRTVNKSDANFVAMDFRGSTGRVIQDPQEVAMIELEQQSSWRRRLLNRTTNNSSGATDKGSAGNSAPSKVAYFTRAIHVTQPWFHGKISREAASDELEKHGSMDGTFLVRESQTMPGGLVITISHNRKSRHIPINQVEKDGRYFYTSDNGETRFLDLIQFIDFHRLNKGSLPCVLLNECSRSYG